MGLIISKFVLNPYKADRKHKKLLNKMAIESVGSSAIAIAIFVFVLVWTIKNLGNIKNFYVFNIRMKLFDSPINVLLEQRKRNKYYPFVETKNDYGEPVFRLNYRMSGYYRLSVAIILMTGDQDAIVMIVVSIIACISLWSLNLGQLSVDVESDGENYTYYHNGKKIYCGHVSDVYIRTKMGYSTGGGGEFYYLVMSGYNIEEYRISQNVTVSRQVNGKPGNELRELKRLGKKIAHGLNLNYFDIADRSKEHRIVHMFSYEDYAKQKLEDTAADKTARASVDFVSKVTSRAKSVDAGGNGYVMRNLGQLKERHTKSRKLEKLENQGSEQKRRASQAIMYNAKVRGAW